MTVFNRKKGEQGRERERERERKRKLPLFAGGAREFKPKQNKNCDNPTKAIDP